MNYVSEIADELFLSSYTHKLGLNDILFIVEMESQLAPGFAYPTGNTQRWSRSSK